MGGFTDVNATGSRLLAYTREEVAGLNVRDVITAEGTARMEPEIARVHAGEVVHSEWLFLPAPLAMILGLAVMLTVVLGFAGTWRALGAKPATYLRNE